MGVRKVRTARGESRYNKPIGAIIGRTRGGVLKAFTSLDDRAENIPGRSGLSAGARAKATRAKIKKVDAERSTALTGGRVPVDSPVLHSSPTKIAQARKARGHIVRDRGEALAGARGRTPAQLAQRAVQFNPLSGRYTASSVRRTGRSVGTGVRPIVRASAARAKIGHQTPTAPVYVGRRRAKD